jgi:8-oxo-dGTP pyrophosphatase MutT (NUDIX family)
MKLRDLVEKKSAPAAATAWVILYTADKVILGKRSPTVNNPNQWNFFGGHLDQGESAAEAAVRELKEETEYTLSASSLSEIAVIGSATYFSARINNAGSVQTTSEISKVKGFKLTDLPDNLHAKTASFFSKLEVLFDK